VDRLVRLHGGTVELRSAGVGHGSEFIVRIPLAAAAAGAGVGAGAPDGADASAPWVVLVEDNPDLRELTADLLAGLGCRVELAADGPEGVERIVQVAPELALVDIGLPLLDGFDVARAVRARLGGAPYLVAVTGYGRGQDREEAAAAGFDELVTKPLKIDKVRELMELARVRHRPSGRA
jgi:CheY-like chemotaxis protein